MSIKIRLSYIVTRWRQRVTFPNQSYWITHEKGVAGRLFFFISSMMDGGWIDDRDDGRWDCLRASYHVHMFNCLILLSIGEELFFFCTLDVLRKVWDGGILIFHCHIRINLERACIYCARSMFFILAAWCVLNQLAIRMCGGSAIRCGPTLLEPAPCVMCHFILDSISWIIGRKDADVVMSLKRLPNFPPPPVEWLMSIYIYKKSH